LNPLFVQADSGNNKRYCENQEINHVPDTLDQEIWPEIEKSLDSSEKVEKNTLLKIRIEQLEQEYLITFIKNMDMKNLMKTF
jgi:hypothetical protein